MQIHQTDFSTGNVYRNIMEVAVPMIIAQILNLLYNIVDRIYIGRIPEIGATALTGVGLCFPIITLITAFTYLFGNGGAPLCSMERGRGNREEAEMLMGNTFVMLIGTGVILTAIGLIFYRPILYAFGAYHFPVLFRHLGLTLPYRKKGDPEPEKKRHEDLLEKSGQYRKPGYVRFFYGIYKQSCAGGMQCHTPDLGW